MFRNAFILFGLAVVISNLGCGANGPSNSASNANLVTNREIKLDPANMPPGLSANRISPSANIPPGISVNAVPPSSGKTPGIPSAEELKKGFKPGKMQTPGIPDAATIRKQMGLPAANVNVPPANSVPMMKSTRKLGGKP